ncbi:BamA/TamA family outer membrane protein [Flavihumibacter stibioxidans]|nr:BamA/TamA family outer membrane protein [Flavihumibacter stibioxidans]
MKRYLHRLFPFIMALVVSITAHSQSDSLLMRLVFIGDAGETQNDRHPVMEALVKQSATWNRKASYLFFMGDNIYPLGLPEQASKHFPEKKAILDKQWQAGLLAAENLVFIPGNHDWAKGRNYGWEQVRQQASYIESLNNHRIRFLPADGCPGPEEINLGNSVTAILLDSQWWLQQEGRPGVANDCECKTEEEVLLRLNDILYRNRNKLVLFIAHHPFMSDGIHGGYYTLRQHLFPFTEFNPRLYIPLPVLGSLYPLLRGGLGNIQDLKHPRYKSMIEGIDSLLNTHPYCIRLAGHEHGLQHLVKNGRQYFVSGSGSKSTRLRKREHTRFNAAHSGYAYINIWQNGKIEMVFEGVNDTSSTTLYSTNLPVFPFHEDTVRVSRRPNFPDSVEVAAAPYFRAGKFKQWLLGTNYRQEWTTAVRVPVLDITRFGGGLTPTKRGGGMQSRSLRLEDESGREYVLRSIEKYPDRTLPEELRQTFIKDAVTDGISASYPFAALSLPPLADAAKIPHLTPSLVFLPDDPALAEFRRDFANALYLFEPREPDPDNKTTSTDKVIKALAKDNDNRVNQESVLKARLLDMFIMDFDRHDDQWRWLEKAGPDGKIFSPVPRDRDQAFFTNDGLLPWLVSQPWLLPKFQGIRPKARNIRTFNFNARYFDRSFLTEPDEKTWQKHIDELLSQMTDSVIDLALSRQPSAIRGQHAADISRTLKERKLYFNADALEYYRFLSNTIEIAGSDKREWFDLEWKEDGHLQLRVFKVNKAGNRSDTQYERLITPGLTREIRLYGLKGDDIFRLRGKAGQSPLIRIIGGGGKDTLIAEQEGLRKGKVKWYDLLSEGNILSGPAKIRSKHTGNPKINQYERNNFRYNKTAPLLSITYNRDDGLFLGGGIRATRHGFRKEPYLWQQSFLASYAVATGAYNFRYQFDAPRFRLLANIKAPNNTRNFFGNGNRTSFSNEGPEKIWFYRSRFNLVELAALYKISPHTKLNILTGPIFQYYQIDIDDNIGKFILDPGSGLDQELLVKPKSYLGWQIQAVADNRNHSEMPSRGFRWDGFIRWVNGQNRYAYSFTQIQSSLAYYISTTAAAKLVLAGRIGAGTNTGRYEFFQAQTLGGSENLRGYRNFRFAGSDMAFHNLDLRLKLTEINGYIIPGTLGMLFFHDIGRVWQKGESSGRWHNGYGAGLWLSPAGRVVITASYARSKEGGLPFITLGFQF